MMSEVAAAPDAEGHEPLGRRWHVETLSRIVEAAQPAHPVELHPTFMVDLSDGDPQLIRTVAD